MAVLNPIRGSKYPHGTDYTSPRLDEHELLARYGTYRKKLARVKHLFRNNFLCQALLKAQRTHVCGNGLAPLGVEAPIRESIWNGWKQRCDVSQTKPYELFLSEVVESMCIGDCLVVLRSSSNPRSDRVSSFVEIVNPGRIDTPSDFTDGVNPKTKSQVILGVEFNSDGLEVGYWVIKKAQGATDSSNFVYVPRYNEKTGRFISRLIRNPETAPNSTRGSSLIDASIPEVEDFAALSDSGVQAGIVKNSMAIGIETDRPDALKDAVQATEEADDNGNVVSWGEVPYGNIFSIPSGSKIHTVSHSGNLDLVQMLQHVKKNFSAGVGRPYEILFGDYAGVNFSAGKLLHDPFWRIVKQWEAVLADLTNEIFAAVTDEGLLVRGISPVGVSRRVSAWIGSPKTEADENKSVNAWLNKIAGGLSSPRQYYAEHGMDEESVHAETKASIESEKASFGFSWTENALKAGQQMKFQAEEIKETQA